MIPGIPEPEFLVVEPSQEYDGEWQIRWGEPSFDFPQGPEWTYPGGVIELAGTKKDAVDYAVDYATRNEIPLIEVNKTEVVETSPDGWKLYAGDYGLYNAGWWAAATHDEISALTAKGPGHPFVLKSSARRWFNDSHVDVQELKERYERRRGY